MSKRKSVLIRSFFGMRLLVRDGYVPKSKDIFTRETILVEFDTGTSLEEVLKCSTRVYKDYRSHYDEICVRTTDMKVAIVGVEQVFPVVEEDPEYWRGLFYGWIETQESENEQDEVLRELRTRKRIQYSLEADDAFQLGQEHMNLYTDGYM